MFLRRNVAGQTFVIPGSLRAVADGSAVVTGVLTLVRDGAAATAAGTLAHISGGAFRYTPTQAETDCAILGYVLEGTGAVTVCGSIRTTQADPNDGGGLGLTRLDVPASSRLAGADYTAPPAADAILAALLAGSPAPRDVTEVKAPTVADCLVAAFCGAAGRESVNGLTYLVRQPDGTGIFRAFTLDSSVTPTSRT